ncbi:hypothetical protein [Psychromonas sp.]
MARLNDIPKEARSLGRLFYLNARSGFHLLTQSILHCLPGQGLLPIN